MTAEAPMQKIRAFAAEQGLLAGVCDADAIGEGLAGEAQPRLDPRRHFPSAQSIVVLGRGYAPPLNPGCLSSLAYGLDYHAALAAHLQTLAALLGGPSLHMVDNGPLCEQPFALKAGLGFRGRNGLVISRRFGSFFNIGLLLTAQQIDPFPAEDVRRANGCPAQCRCCAKACPGGAISAAGIDNAACVSGLTQKRSGLASAKAALGHLYGCDRCQLVCPHNAAIQPLEVPSFMPAQILALDEAAFEAQFGHTAMAWRGLAHLQRNARILLSLED